MRKLFLKDAQAGDIVEDVFVISGKQFAPTSTGKFFIKAFVSDRTLQVTSRLWNATRETFSAIPESGFLRIKGRIENYQQNLQLIIEQLWPAKDGTYDIGDLMPQTDKDIDKMFARLTEIMGSIQNRHLAALVQEFFNDQKLMEDLRRAPAAMSFHHSFIGGLLEHTLNAIEVADAVVRFYPGLSRDLVLAGIFLHDLAKTWELTYQCSFGYSDGGQLVGHIVKAAMWVEQKRPLAEQTLGEKIPQPLIDVIEHIILSHHGEPEFGAAKVPATPEAIFVHTIENLDAKMMMSLGATRGDNAGGEGNWTEFQKAFGVRLFKPDVAPADAPVTEEPEAPAEESAAPTLNLKISNPLFESSPTKKK